MRLRAFARLAVCGAVAVGAWHVAGFAQFGLGRAHPDAGSQTVVAKTFNPPIAAAAQEEIAGPAPMRPAAPIPDAAVVHASLLSPYPMHPGSAAPLQQAALTQTEPVESLMTGSIRSIPEANESSLAVPTRSTSVLADVKKAIAEPRLDKDGILTVGQIARIKASLNLSPDQEQYWVPVEAELRDIARQLAAQKARGKKAKAALGAVDAQRLYWAAGPLIMSLREDQKQEVRRLARAMGLEQVASLI